MTVRPFEDCSPFGGGAGKNGRRGDFPTSECTPARGCPESDQGTDKSLRIITPTTQLPYSDFVPWRSKLFLTHIVLASIGFFGFIGATLILAVRGPGHAYPRMRVFQYGVLLPVWLVGEGIALANAFIKALFRFRLYDFL